MIKSLLIVTALFSYLIIYSQTTYFVKNKFSGESIPFVKVYPSIGNPFLGDIDGILLLNESVETIKLHVSGFEDTLIVLAQVESFTIYMTV